MAGTTLLLAPEPQENETDDQKNQTTSLGYLTSEEIYERIRQIFLEDESTDPKCQRG